MLRPLDSGLSGELFEELSSQFGTVICNTVSIPKERSDSLDPATVARIKASLQIIGLRSPITVAVTPGEPPELLLGAHRATAWRQLSDEGMALFHETGDTTGRDRWFNIPCFKVDAPTLTPEMREYLELAENRDRKESTAQERKIMAARMLQLEVRWAKPPEGEDGKSPLAKSPMAKKENLFKAWYEKNNIPERTATRYWDAALEANAVTGKAADADIAMMGALANFLLATEDGEAKERKENGLLNGFGLGYRKCIDGGVDPAKIEARYQKEKS